MRWKLAIAAALGVAAISVWLVSGPAGAVAPSPETGAEIAARWCAECHVISPSGDGIPHGPDFPHLAESRSKQQILAALSGPHAQPLRGFTLSPREVADIAAYIDSLKEQTASQ